jgi:hypothetical protein
MINGGYYSQELDTQYSQMVFNKGAIAIEQERNTYFL